MRFLIGFIIAIGLLIIAFIAIFHHGSSTHTSTNQTSLTDYANSSVTMGLTIEGPISANQTHREIRMTVGQDSSTMDLIQGYQGQVIDSKTYNNNSTSYADFLAALQRYGFNLGVSDKSIADERGYCSGGNRYVMQITDGSHDIQRYWTSSCGGTATFKGKTANVLDLFERQFPDYGNFSTRFSEF